MMLMAGSSPGNGDSARERMLLNPVADGGGIGLATIPAAQSKTQGRMSGSDGAVPGSGRGGATRCSSTRRRPTDDLGGCSYLGTGFGTRLVWLQHG